MWWLVEHFANVFRERKMEIIMLVRDTKVCRETRLISIVRKFGHILTILYPSKSFFEASFES